MDSDETKADLSGPSYTNQPERDLPPPYNPPQTGIYPVIAQPQPIGVVGTNIGVVGMNVGVDGTNVGVVGTNVGMVEIAAIPVIVTNQMSPKPMPMVCRSCNRDITTRVVKKSSLKTHFFAGLLCLMGCWCCCCIPYCTDSCLNSDHYCPHCNAYIGSYNP